jgi:Arc/MetJ-type ribon-helix-helix transcriptional regulator
MKKPMPISVDEDMIDWIQKQANSGEFRNRSHVVERALMEFKQKLSR